MPNALLSSASPAWVGLLAQAAPSGASAFISQVGPLVAILGIVYFLIIRPQQAETKKHQGLLASLQKGDGVVLSSGLHGAVFEVSADTVVLEIAPGTLVTVDKSAIKHRPGASAPAQG